jgi:hypothetical protein
MAQFGGLDAQLARFGAGAGNGLTNIQGQSVNGHMSSAPTPVQLALIQKGGKKCKKCKKGGFIGPIINQALVPLGILGMQQSFRRTQNGYQGTRKYRKY